MSDKEILELWTVLREFMNTLRKLDMGPRGPVVARYRVQEFIEEYGSFK